MSDPEPGSSAEHAIPRPGARVVILDAAGRVLLVRSEFDGRALWFTPGGALDEGESFEQAALRELREEIGLEGVTLGPWIWERQVTWLWEQRGTWYDTRERIYLLRLDEETPPIALTEATEHGSEEIVELTEARWWSLEDLRASGELVSPRALCELLEPLVRGEVPSEPVRVGL
jgi:ADP-ribose pyrophosphatase YjhB (NUDIX family)